jgi:hypothetical protein
VTRGSNDKRREQRREGTAMTRGGSNDERGNNDERGERGREGTMTTRGGSEDERGQ